MEKLSRGLTLIELMMVIIIIAILMLVLISILMPYLASSKNAAIQAQTGEMIKASMLYSSDTGGDYSDLCDNTANNPNAVTFLSGINQISSRYSGKPNCLDKNRNPDICASGQWAVETLLGSGGYWCVDSTGEKEAGDGSVFAGKKCSCTSIKP